LLQPTKRAAVGALRLGRAGLSKLFSAKAPDSQADAAPEGREEAKSL
jgi:hypothetical protein